METFLYKTKTKSSLIEIKASRSFKCSSYTCVGRNFKFSSFFQWKELNNNQVVYAGFQKISFLDSELSI
jgi:hypothetical protein